MKEVVAWLGVFLITVGLVKGAIALVMLWRSRRG